MGLKAMKNTRKRIMICGALLLLLLTMTTLTSALRVKSPASSGILDSTTVRGFVLYLGMDRTGRTTHLFALRVHYLTITLSGEHDRGVVRMKPIDVPTKMIGYHGMVYISATFRGSLKI
jgi:hypothetical protein